MSNPTSRRDFLASSLAIPVAASFAGRQAETTKLDMRTLGKTGLDVTSLGFGCMTTPDPAVIERAASLGINFFDTARVYQNGNNERMVGAALKGRRQQVIICSKSIAKTKQEALAELDTSLRELRTDYLDIWYLHNKNTPEELPDELFEAQREAKKAGKIRFAGVTTHFNMVDMLPYLVECGQTDVTLASYNFTLKPELTDAIQAARRAGMGVVAMKVLAGGFSRIQRGDRLYGAAPDSLTNTLKREGAMLAAIKWALKNRSVDTAIICMTNFDQLNENLRAMSEPFTNHDQELLADQMAYIGPMYCRMCGSCGGVCDKGVPVSDMLRFLSYAEGYGQFAMARGHYLELPTDVRRIQCRDCSSCSVNCPNGVEVQNRLIKAQALFA
jgi:aryl-alcohol dehydrogenase-like predicted oxidoreductase